MGTGKTHYLISSFGAVLPNGTHWKGALRYSGEGGRSEETEHMLRVLTGMFERYVQDQDPEPGSE